MSSGKYASEIIKNAHYTILFKAGQMAYLIRSLGLRLSDYTNLSQAYKLATAGRNFKYLCVNAHPRASEIERYSTDILPNEAPVTLYINKQSQ